MARNRGLPCSGMLASHAPERWLLMDRNIHIRLSGTAFAQVYPFFHWLIVNIPSFVQLSDAQQAEPLPADPQHGVTEPAA